jgi:putative flippase GtrA
MTTLPKTLRVANLQIPETALFQSGRLWRRYESLCPVWFRQAVKFFSVGVLNTVLDIGLYLVLTHWLGILAAWPVVAKTISYGAGVLNSFYWNKSWTFKSEASALTTLAPFVLSNLVATAINAGVMHLGLTIFNLPENVSLVLATGITFLWNFTISKFIIFKK